MGEPMPLPASLRDLLEFQSLTEAQKANFESRLLYVEEIVETIASLSQSAGADWKGIIDDLELDVAVNLNTPSGDEFVSSWLIHSSWTFGLQPSDLRNALGASIMSRLERKVPSSTAPLAEVHAWLLERGDALRVLLLQFNAAATAGEAISSLIAIDIVLAQLLLATYMCRLNDHVLGEE